MVILRKVNKRNDSPVSTAKSMKSVRPLLQQNPSSVQRFAPKTSSQSSKGSEGLVAGKTVHQVQTKKKCSFVLSGNIKDRKDLENRFSKGHQLKPKHIVCPYGDKPALLIFEKNVDIKVLRSLLKPFKIKQLPSEESKFLVLDGLMERLHNAGQEKMVLSNLQNFTGVEVTRQDNKVYLIGVTTGQIDIAKDYLEEFVKGLNIPMNEQSDSTTTSDVLDEEWDNQISTLKNVSEVEFKALMILEHGFDRIKNVELSWHDDAIIIDRQSSDTSVLAYLTSQLKVLRNKQSVEIALDEEEKKIVKDVMKDVHSEDIVCVYDEAKCLVVVYSDKQDNIMKFKHKLKFQTGKLKESVRNRKRFAENTQLSEISMQNFNSSFRSAEIGEDFAWSKGEVDKFYTKENIKVSVYTADILNLPVDCIVNAANDRMQHGGGVARVIADAAGPDLIQEGDEIIRRCGRIQVGCQVTTTPGRLPYKCVIHTVGPCWSDYQPHDLKKVQECEENLYASIYGCFQEAERMGLSSIALPAVSSGIYAVPKKMCAVQYAKAVLDYSQTSRQGQALKEIHFIDKLPDLVKLMQDTFRTMIQEGKVPDYNIHNYVASSSRNQRQQSKETGRKGNRNQLVEVNHCQYENTEPEGLSPVYYEQGENNKGRFVFQVSEKPVVFIYEGDILKLKHIDAIVCPDDSEGTSRGRIASELKKNKNYSKTKDMCFKQRKPNLGDLVIIDGKEIPKVIVHVVLENNSPRRQEFMSVIQKSFDNILRQMNEWENVKTIAMPLFGVKRELLTQKMWAETFLDRFVAFCCKVKNPSLEEVHIIAHFSSSSALSAVKKVFTEFADKVNKKVPPPKPLADEFNKSPSHHKVPPARPPSPEMYSTCDDTDEPMSGQENESENGDTDDSCTICMCLKTDPKSLSCGHSFCSECINQMLKHKPVCAICGNIVGIITGNQPEDGSMSVKTSPIDLAGYEGHGCIEITYDFPAGRQGVSMHCFIKWGFQSNLP
ncbi:hypothetical protein ACJMK2_006332 [Sinanodonta woodiana]|uniref:Uncharacterized protein n=1 Tax=Sinanodonta woodiana TaxID=1069815 RepID=A0ABD3VWB4_SINWO